MAVVRLRDAMAADVEGRHLLCTDTDQHRSEPTWTRRALAALQTYVFAGQGSDPCEGCDPLPAHMGAGKKICSSRRYLGARNGHNGHGIRRHSDQGVQAIVAP